MSNSITVPSPPSSLADIVGEPILSDSGEVIRFSLPHRDGFVTHIVAQDGLSGANFNPYAPAELIRAVEPEACKYINSVTESLFGWISEPDTDPWYVEAAGMDA